MLMQNVTFRLVPRSDVPDCALRLFLQVLVVNAQGDVTRVSTRSSKEVVMKGTISQFFKLGQEGKYRVYHNQYSSNALALNKHQHREASSRKGWYHFMCIQTLKTGSVDRKCFSFIFRFLCAFKTFLD